MAQPKPTVGLRAATSTATLVVVTSDLHSEMSACTLAGLVDPGSRVILLAVRPEPDKVRSRGIMQEKVARHLTAEAETWLEPIRQTLASAGVETATEVRLAEDPEAILDAARVHCCKTIVVPGLPLAGARRWWRSAFGCVGNHIGARLAAVSRIPVVVMPIEARGR